MNLQLFLSLYFICLPVFVLLDLLWVSVIAKSFYQERLVHHLGPVNLLAAAAFYLVIVLGLTIFATYPTVTRGVLVSGLILGGFFGFFTYATFALTNLSVMRDWPYLVALADLVWGAFVGAAATAITYILYAKFF